MVVGKNKTMQYDVENRLTFVINPLSSESYLYDGDGGRVRKTRDDGGGTIKTTTYIGSLYEVESDGKTTKHIFAGSQKIATIELQSSNLQLRTYYHHTDHLGSSSVITDETGNKVSDYQYEPYGKITQQTGTSVTNYKFTGKELDSTGLYFYGARYYDPEIGRFISADTTIQHPFDPQDLNRYAYCRNNPINYIDPTGLGFKKWLRNIFQEINRWFNQAERGLEKATGAEWDINVSGGSSIPIGPGGNNQYPSTSSSGQPTTKPISQNLPTPAEIIIADTQAINDALLSSFMVVSSEDGEENKNGGSVGIWGSVSAGASWVGQNILEPIYNTLSKPGYNYGQWMWGKKNLKTFYGASLDSIWAITGVYGGIGGTAASGAPYWRYVGPASKPTYDSTGKLLNKTWLTRGGKAPYDSMAVAKDKLQLPYTPTSVERVNAPFYKYIAGPGKVWRNPQ